MEAYTIFRSLAIIIIFAKVCGIAARKLKAPQVVGEIIAGLIVGPSILHLVEPTAFLAQMAEIGVVLLMFSAGLETDLGASRLGGGGEQLENRCPGHPIIPPLWCMSRHHDTRSPAGQCTMRSVR